MLLATTVVSASDSRSDDVTSTNDSPQNTMQTSEQSSDTSIQTTSSSNTQMATNTIDSSSDNSASNTHSSNSNTKSSNNLTTSSNLQSNSNAYTNKTTYTQTTNTQKTSETTSTSDSTIKDTTNTQSSISNINSSNNEIKENTQESTKTVSSNLVDEKKQVKTFTEDGTSYTVNSYNDLSSAIEDIQGKDVDENYTITLSQASSDEDYYILDSTPLTWGSSGQVVKNLTINGNGQTINGQGQYQFITVSSGYSLTLANITIIDCLAESDTAVLYNNGNLTLNNTTITGNTAGGPGEGYAVIYSNSGYLTIDNSTLTENIATGTTESHGGLIYIRSGIANITNSIISDNSATGSSNSYGGAIYNYEATLTINNSTITHNTVEGTTGNSYGGVIYNQQGTIIINDSKFSDNTAIGGTKLGGVIYTNSGTLTINTTTFSENSMEGYAGAIYINSGTTSIANSTLNDNYAYLGGSIYNKGTLTINNTTATKSSSGGDGAVIYNTGTVTIENSTFEENYATTSGGIMYDGGSGTVTILNSVFSKNTALRYAGVIDKSSGILIVRNSSFTQNTASNHGGAIYMYGGTSIEVTDSIFTENEAIGSSSNTWGHGGAIYVERVGTVTITNTNFTQNNAVLGGAIRIGGSVMTITDSKFTENIAMWTGTNYGYGGAIYNFQSSSVTITGTTFTENQAIGESDNYGQGGALYNNDTGEIVIINCEFIDNIATSFGGAIYNNESESLSIESSTFTENKVIDDTGSGGAIYNGATLTIDETDFIENTADNGGAIYDDGLTIDVKGSKFIYNTADLGGAIYSYSSGDSTGTVTIDNSEFSGNVATTGGALYNKGSTLTMTDVDFTLNDATESGGAIYEDSGNTQITNAVFTSNSATESGGAIYLANTDELTIKDSIFTLNTAGTTSEEGLGGAIYNCATLTIENSNFTANRADNGGAIYEDGGNSEITTTKFASNSVTNDGGALYVYEGDITLTSGIFTLNTAGNDGGAIYVDTSKTINIKDSNFTYNSATRDGGAVYVDGVDDMTISNGIFRESSAENGGAIYVEDLTKLTIDENSLFRENDATIGGAIHIADGNDVTITDATFRENTADNGGAIYIGDCDSITITSTIFRENSATNGGAISNSGTLKIESSNLYDNTATNGGAVSNIDGVLTIQEDSKFTTNTATESGGAVYSTGTLVVENNEFVENSAEINGGAIYSTGSLEIVNTEFTTNTAKSNGGAIYSTSDSTISNNDFTTNTATEFGGAIYNSGSAKLTNNNFIDNIGEFNNTIFNSNEDLVMSSNYIKMYDYYTDAFVDLKMYSPIIDTTVSTASDTDPSVTIIYDITSLIDPENKLVITRDDSYETYVTCEFIDAGIYTVDIIFKDSTNDIEFNVIVTDQAIITLDQDIVALPTENIIINGTLLSSTSQAYGSYDDKTVDIYANGELLKSGVTVLANGTFTFEYNVIEGSNFIYAVFEGNEYLLSAFDETHFIASKIETSIEIDSIEDITIGESVTISFELQDVNENIVENAEFIILINNKEVTETVTFDETTGKYSFEYIPTSAGEYFVSIYYDGSEMYLSSRDLDGTFNVNLKTAEIEINAVDTANVGEDLEVTIELTGIEDPKLDSLKVTVNYKEVSINEITDNNDGTFTFTLTPESDGSYTITATYTDESGDYPTLTDTHVIVASKIKTSLDIKSDTTKINEDATITITLTDEDEKLLSEDIKVTITVNGVNYQLDTKTTDGVVEIELGTLETGVYTIEAIFEGDNVYENSHYTYSFAVTEKNVELDITSYDKEIITTETTTIKGTLKDDDGPIETSNIQVTIDGVVQDKNAETDTDGEFTYDFTTTTVGVHTITFTYVDTTGVHIEISQTISITASKIETQITVDATDTIVGQESIISGKLTTKDETTGIKDATIIVRVDGVIQQETTVTIDEDGSYSTTYTPQKEGTYTVEVVYEGSDKYSEAQATDTFIATQLSTTLTIEPIEDITFNDTVTITGVLLDENKQPISDATISVYINGVKQETTTIANGSYTIENYKPTSTGIVSVLVEYNGDNLYTSSENERSFNVNKVSTTIEVTSIDNVGLNNVVTVSFELINGNDQTAIADQEFYITVNGKQISTEISYDTDTRLYSFTYTPTTTGTYDIVIEYDGNEYYLYSHGIDSFTIDAETSEIVIVNVEDVFVSQETTVTATLYESDGITPIVAGSITVTVNGETIETIETNDKGEFEYTFTPDKEGAYTITFDYTDDNGIHSSTSKTVVITASKIKTQLTVTTDANSINNVVISGHLTGNGNSLDKQDVLIYVNGEYVTTVQTIEGTYSYTYTQSEYGTTTVDVYFEATDTYESSHDATSYSTYEQNAQITIKASNNNPHVLDSVLITGTLTDDDGTALSNKQVEISIDNQKVNVTTNSTGGYSYTFTPQKSETYTVTATYTNIEGNSKVATTTITASKIKTNISLENINDITIGDTVTITGRLTDTNGKAITSANIIITVNSQDTLVTTNSNGQFTIENFKASTSGTYTVTAQYDGSTIYEVSHTSIIFNVLKIPTIVSVTPTNDIKINETITITGSLEDVNGNIISNKDIFITINNETFTVKTNDNGQYNLTYKPAKTGSYSVYVEFIGDDTYIGNTTAAAFTTKKLETTITVEDVVATVGDTINLTASVVDENGNTVSEGKVAFKINDVTLKDDYGNVIYVDVVDGVATLPYLVNNSAKNYTITGLYYGSDNYYTDKSFYGILTVEKDTVDSIITVSNVTEQFGNIVNITAKIVDSDGNLVTGGKVAFKLNSVTIKDEYGEVIYAEVVDGYASILYKITNNVKNYTLTAVYSGSDRLESSRSNEAILTVTPRIANVTIDKLDNNIKSGDNVTFKATIIEDDTTYTNDGVIIFKINSKTIRDEEGNPIIVDVNDCVATLNFTIPVDFAGKDYNITAVYTNNNYLRAEGNNTLTTVRSNVQTELNSITVKSGENAQLTMVLYDENGNQLERDTKVAIKIDGHTLIHMNTTSGLLNVTLPTSSLDIADHRLDIVFGENQGYYELRLNTTIKVV